MNQFEKRIEKLERKQPRIKYQIAIIHETLYEGADDDPSCPGCKKRGQEALEAAVPESETSKLLLGEIRCPVHCKRREAKISNSALR